MLTTPSIRPPAAAASLPSVTITGDLDTGWDIPQNQHLLIISRNQSWLTHGFHRYPAKFFPELPRWAIHKYSEIGQTVLDPMMGSGTVNVECLLAGRHSFGVDIDAFARLLSRVKTTPLDSARLDRAAQVVLEGLEEMVSGGDETLHRTRAWIPEFSYRETWFRSFILDELGAIRSLIARVPDAVGQATATPYVDFFHICLSSIIREVSNADNNCTRTVVRQRLNKRIVPGMAFRLFKKVLQINVDRMREFVRVFQLVPGETRVHLPEGADARSLPLAHSSLDLAVTSPPYINAVDYPRTHQLEMYWLDLAPPGVPLAEAKRHHIGTEVVRSIDYRELRRTGLPNVDRQVERIFAVDPRRAYIVHRYFVDMERNFQEVRRVLKPGARYVVVVGNNIIRGQEVPTHRYLMDVGARAGLGLETYFASEVIRHYIKVPRKERITQDWVLVFRK